MKKVNHRLMRKLINLTFYNFVPNLAKLQFSYEILSFDLNT